MFLFSLLQLISIIFTIGHLVISYLYYFFYRLFRLVTNRFIRKRSHKISLIDEISTSILSLLSIDVCNNSNGKADFLMHCRKEYWNNQSILSKIDEFEMTYRSEPTINWYTRDTFVYRIINKALRSGNVQIIDSCQFIIRELHLAASSLHQTNYQRDIIQPPQIYYHGTVLSTEDLKKLTVGKIITFNSFISTSSSREVAMMFAGNALIEIEVNNRTGLYAIFHSILDESNFKDEEEILFSTGNVFRVEQIQWCTKKSIWKVKLILQKHLQYRSNFEIKSTNNINQHFIEHAWKKFNQFIDQYFQILY